MTDPEGAEQQSNRLRPQEVVAGLAGLALLVSLFLPWAVVGCGAGCEVSSSGWDSLSLIDLILTFVAAGAIALPVVAATNRKSDAPITGDAMVALGGCAALFFTVYRLLDPPGGDGRGIGIWIALVAALLIAASAWSAMADEGT